MTFRYYDIKTRIILIMLLIAVASITIRLLIDTAYGKSAVLYVGIPFCIASVLVLLRSTDENPSWAKRYLNHTVDAFIVMFVTSIILFEGFICVLMFMPIYLIVIVTAFIIHAIVRRFSSTKDKIGVSILPLLVLGSALEGTTPILSTDRVEIVEVSRVIDLGINEIKQNLTEPIALQKQRHWFLEIFPMPHLVNAGSINPGDIHEVHFKYYRWFVTNLHEGRMLLRISTNDQDGITTTFLDDTSYISNYMNLRGTEISFNAITEHRTQISLKIEFERTLDPYWYFSPLERFGIEKTCELVLDEIFERKSSQHDQDVALAE